MPNTPSDHDQHEGHQPRPRPRRPVPSTDHDRLNQALRALQDARNGIGSTNPDTVHDPHPNDLVRAGQVLDAAIAIVRVVVTNVLRLGMQPDTVRQQLGEYARLVVLPGPGEDESGDAEDRVHQAIARARAGSGWVEVDVEDLVAVFGEELHALAQSVAELTAEVESMRLRDPLVRLQAQVDALTTERDHYRDAVAVLRPATAAEQQPS